MSLSNNFLHYRELVVVLLRDQDKGITGVALVRELCQLYDTFLAASAENYAEKNVRI